MPQSASRSGRVLAAIRQSLASGRFKAGELLPAEQDLAVHLGVSRGTLRVALKQLEDEGLLRAEPRRGRVVVGTQSAATGLMSSTVALLSWTQTDRWPRRSGHAMIETEFAVLDALSEESLHSMVLHPDRLVGVELQQLLHDRPLGVVVSHRVADAPDGQAIVRQLTDHGIPVVFNGNHRELQHVDRVSSDYSAATAELTRRLLAMGRRRILRLWEVPPNYWLTERDAGYEEAMREAGLEPLPAVHVPGLHRVGRDPEPSFEARMTMTAGVLVPYLTGDTRIDAIMVHTDSAAMVAAEACRSFGLRPHDDVAIVGYDDNWDADEIRRTMPRHAEGMPPPLLTVDKQNTVVGQQMLALLLRRTRGELAPQPQHVVVPGRVVEVAQQRL